MTAHYEVRAADQRPGEFTAKTGSNTEAEFDYASGQLARAASLGWPDAYAYTKALGERALLQNRGDLPVTIVRPSIIESSLA